MKLYIKSIRKSFFHQQKFEFLAYTFNASTITATGKTIKIPASKAPKFKAGTVLKKAVK